MPFDPKNPANCGTCHVDTTPSCNIPTNSIDSITHTGFTNPMQSYNIVGGQYNVGDFLRYMEGMTMPLFTAYMQNYPTIAQLLFDLDTVMTGNGESAKPLSILKYKSFPNIDMKEVPLDGDRFIWSEWKYEPEELYIYQDGTNTNQLIIAAKDGSPVSLNTILEVKDTIYIYANDPTEDFDTDCCSEAIERTITAVDTVTIGGLQYGRVTIEGSGITFKGRDTGVTYEGLSYYPGDFVLKLFHGRNDCEPITNTFQTYGNKMKQSFIQHLGYNFQMTKGELNKSYDTKEGVLSFLKKKFRGANIEMVRQAANMFYLGRNRDPKNSAGLPGETLGILNLIYNMQALKPELRLVRDASRLTSDDAKVRLILGMILMVQNSGMIPRGSVTTMVCDETAMTSLLKMNHAWNKFTGFTVNRGDNVQKDFTLPVVQTPNGKTEIMQCSQFTRLTRNRGTILFISKPLVGLRARPNATINLESGSIVKASQGFNIKEVTDPKNHECFERDVRTEMSNIIGGADTGAHAILEGFCS